MKYSDAAIGNIDPKIRDLLKQNTVKENVEYTDENGETKNYQKIVGFRKGLFLYGSTGVGKTYALYAIENQCKKMGIKTNLENWVELLLNIRSNLDKQLETLNYILEPSVIMIDDIGAEKQTEWSQEQLYMIVNRCYVRGKTLFIATNLTLAEFREKYGDRILSRINEMCEVTELAGTDRRFE